MVTPALLPDNRTLAPPTKTLNLWIETAGLLFREEYASIVEDEDTLMKKDDQDALEESLRNLRSYRFHQIRDLVQVEQLWSSIRQSTAMVDVVLNTTIRFKLLMGDEIAEIVPKVAEALGIGSYMQATDTDLADRTVGVEDAGNFFHENHWYLVVFLAMQAMRSRDFGK